MDDHPGSGRRPSRTVGSARLTGRASPASTPAPNGSNQRRPPDELAARHFDLSLQRAGESRFADADKRTAAETVDWGDAADRIDERIAEGPSWPLLNSALCLAAQAGRDVESILAGLMTAAPLPHDDPAAELHYRLLGSSAEATTAAESATGPAPRPTGERPAGADTSRRFSPRI